MNSDNYDSLNALRDIKDIMERSAKFISLSGWSGIWAGSVALVGSYIAHTWLSELPNAYYNAYREAPAAMSVGDYNNITLRFIILAMVVLATAFAGGVYFTWRKTTRKGQKAWNAASKRMIWHMAVPLLAGGIFSLLFLRNGHEMYIAPACLVFYGLALINGSKFTVSDIKYLGYLELLLGFITMLMPGYGLTFWAIGFGGLHILYGIIVWNKYDKGTGKPAA